jgi:hypothetical protein
MALDLWLPIGYDLIDDLKIKSIRYAGDDWQILDTNGHYNILLLRYDLALKLQENNFIDKSLFINILFGLDTFAYILSNNIYQLRPVQDGISIKTKSNAMSFALSIKESRKLLKDASFHDAIYLEQYSRLIPVWSFTPPVTDEEVLATWITDGVVISMKSFRRLSSLTAWMSVNDLCDIIQAAGFDIPDDSGLILSNKFSFSNTNSSNTKDINKSDKLLPFKLPGRPQLEKFFNDNVIDIILNPENYQQFGIDFPAPIILHGPTGCGKTFAVDKLLDYIGWPSYPINSNNVASPFIHDTSKKISQVFDKAIENAPSVIVIDEMESYLTNRSYGSAFNIYHVEEVGEFLRRIPEAINNQVLIIAMTNMIDLIDPAIIRRGRFDYIIEVALPSREEVASLIASLVVDLPLANDICFDNIINTLTGKPLSDCSFVIREAARLAAKNRKQFIDQDTIDIVINNIPIEQSSKRKPIGFHSANNN